MSAPARDWNSRYVTGDLPWDSGIASKELREVIDRQAIAPGRALDLGCGTGTNAIWLAQHGFEVTGLDLAEAAIEIARQKAVEAQTNVNWIAAPVEQFGEDVEPFDFVFDRGCYHICRRVDLKGYIETHRRVTHSGSLCLVLAGSVSETGDSGIPKVTEEELRTEFTELYETVDLHPFQFEDGDGQPGPQGWSSLMRRR